MPDKTNIDTATAEAHGKDLGLAGDPLRDLLRRVVEVLMSAEADAACGARWGERRRDRVNSRNGYRARAWDTKVGKIELAIPKLRHGTYFPSWLLEPRRTAERTLTAVVAEAYARGLSPRRVAALLASLGIERLSKAQLWKVTGEMETVLRIHRDIPARAAVTVAAPGPAAAAADADKLPAAPPEKLDGVSPAANRGST
jgi:transposase-like protein